MSRDRHSWATLTFIGEFEGVRVAATHGHNGGLLDGFVRSDQYAYVFHGPTHRSRDERVRNTRIVNPGVHWGLRFEPRFIGLLDLGVGDARFVNVAD